MPFEWMNSEVPASALEKGVERRRKMQMDDLRVRVNLLKRLGHPREYALHRCLGNVAWGFEMAGESALSDDEIRTLVVEIYAR